MGLEKNILSTKTQKNSKEKWAILWNGCGMLTSVGLFEVVELKKSMLTLTYYLWEKKYYEKEIKASQ